MKHCYLLLLPLLFASNTASAQQSQKELIKQQAGFVVAAVIKHDFVAVIKSMPPKVIQIAGGEGKLLDIMEKGLVKMKSQGASIDTCEIGEPGDIIKAQDVLYAIIPEKIIMQSNGTKFSGTSSLLAISMNKGSKWYFVDVGKMSAAQLKSLFPTVYNKLVIPKQSPPVAMH